MSEPAPVPVESTPDPAAHAAQLERRIAEMEATHHARLVRAELKAEAIRHGMVDLDGLKLLDHTSVEVDAGGEVRNGAAVMKELKRAKPWLFGQSGTASSSSTATPPSASCQAASDPARPAPTTCTGAKLGTFGISLRYSLACAAEIACGVPLAPVRKRAAVQRSRTRDRRVE